MHTVKVVLDDQLSALNFPNEIRVITQAIVHAANTQYHCDLNHHITAALHRDPDTLITNVYQNDFRDMVSVRLIEVVNQHIAAAHKPSKGILTTTCHRVSACFFFNVHHHHDGTGDTANVSDTLDAVVW